MSQGDIDHFKAAVLEAEQSRQAEPLVSLFAADATLDSPAHDEPLRGELGAREFWQDYLHAFQTVKSTFTTTHALGDTVVLEWRSEGALPTGRPITYRGASILKFAGGKIASFVAYYDSAQFLLETTAAVEMFGTGALNNEGGD